MSNLLNIHEWLTLDKSASYLSHKLNKSVEITDLYHLALDRKLTLSVRFLEPVSALHGKFVEEDEFFAEAPDENTDESHCDSEYFFTPSEILGSSEPVDDDTWFIYEDIAQNINGTWDLTMLGWESVDIEERYLDALGECGYNPKRYEERGIFVRQGTLICKLLNKIEPSPVFEDKDFVGGIIRDFLDRERIPYGECINHDFDTLAVLLTPSQLDHVTIIIDAMSVSFPTDKLYRNCLTIEDYSYQMVIRTQAIEEFIQLFEKVPQEVNPEIASPIRDEKRTVLLRIIEVLCKKVGIDPKQRGVTTALVSIVECADKSLSDDTIRKILSQIEPVNCPKSKLQVEKPLATNERNSLFVLIASLCKHAGLDYEKRETVVTLNHMTQSNGTPLPNETISQILSQIRAEL